MNTSAVTSKRPAKASKDQQKGNILSEKHDKDTLTQASLEEVVQCLSLRLNGDQANTKLSQPAA